MKKSKYIIFSFLAIIIMVAIASHATDYSKAYNEWSHESIRQLNARGKHFIAANMPDSALVCFTMASGKYTPALGDSDKVACSTALNNAAYIYFFFRNDYS